MVQQVFLQREEVVTILIWSNGIDQDLNTDLNSAWYSVIVTDILGCTVEDSVFVPKGLGTCIIPTILFHQMEIITMIHG